ncbi:zinc finger protein 510 [Phyllostomus discolor]|uniref:Zinc finger protein 510 n=1 Tax=Phyllostomus discolor TaxID=89673 RepID=A0A834BFD4_9CHIR|nr:zinc finger protein 510 [Phyllostomus discolor]
MSPYPEAITVCVTVGTLDQLAEGGYLSQFSTLSQEQQKMNIPQKGEGREKGGRETSM